MGGDILNCPECGSTNYVHNGTRYDNRTPQNKCTDCGKIFLRDKWGEISPKRLEMKNEREKMALKCPKCNCVEYSKAGKIKGNQRYKCKKCGCQYQVKKINYERVEQMAIATLLYINYRPVSDIARIVDVSEKTIYSWMKQYDIWHDFTGDLGLENIRKKIKVIDSFL